MRRDRRAFLGAFRLQGDCSERLSRRVYTRPGRRRSSEGWPLLPHLEGDSLARTLLARVALPRHDPGTGCRSPSGSGSARERFVFRCVRCEEWLLDRFNVDTTGLFPILFRSYKGLTLHMSPDSMPDSPAQPSASPSQCTATSREGKRCRAWAIKGKDVCRVHAMTDEERYAFTRAGIKARQDRARAREDAVEAAKMGLKALMAQRLEAEADALTARLRSLALSPDDAIALRGIELWLSRVHGRAVQPTRDETPEIPEDVERLRSLSPEERRALLRALG